MQRQEATESNLLRLSGRVYELLILVYPAQFRREYSGQMAQVFRDETRAVLHNDGVDGLIGWWALTLFDLIVTAFEEHFWEIQHMLTDRITRLGGPAAIHMGIMFILLGLGSLLGEQNFLMDRTFRTIFISLFLLPLPLSLSLVLLRVSSTFRETTRARLPAMVAVIGIALTIVAFISSVHIVGWLAVGIIIGLIAFAVGIIITGIQALAARNWLVGGSLTGIIALMLFSPIMQQLGIRFGGIGFLNYSLVIATYTFIVIGLLFFVLAYGLMRTPQTESSETTKRPLTSIPLTVAALGVITLIGTVIFTQKSWKDQAARAEINDLLLTTIPEEATNLHMESFGFFEWYAYARFDAPREDVEAWLADGVVCFKTDPTNMKEGMLYTPGQVPPGWWERDSMEIIASDFCPDDYVNHPYLFLDIAQVDDDLWTVYIYADDT